MQNEPKFLNKEYFVRLGRWKTKRQTSNYESNAEKSIIELTRLAYTASDPTTKLNYLRQLRGVGVAVAATILHYFHPNVYPIFDYHARNTLTEAGYWKRGEDAASVNDWLEYVKIMQRLSKRIGMSLRDLDKALFAYDKYGGNVVTPTVAKASEDKCWFCKSPIATEHERNQNLCDHCYELRRVIRRMRRQE